MFNTNLTDENLTLLNRCPIPTELHTPIPDKLYQFNEKLQVQQNIWKTEVELSVLKSLMKSERSIIYSKIDALSTGLRSTFKNLENHKNRQTKYYYYFVLIILISLVKAKSGPYRDTYKLHTRFVYQPQNQHKNGELGKSTIATDIPGSYVPQTFFQTVIQLHSSFDNLALFKPNLSYNLLIIFKRHHKTGRVRYQSPQQSPFINGKYRIY